MMLDPVLLDLAVANLLCFGPWLAAVLFIVLLATWGDGPPK